MKKENFKKRFSHFIPLFAVFIYVAVGFSLFSYEKWMLIGLTVSAALFYVVWGIAHHSVHRDLSVEVVLEYAAVALLGSIILSSVIFYM